MDHMDIDSVVYVPDTPDRLVARESKFKNIIDVPDSPDIEVVGVKVNSCNDKEIIGTRANENGIQKLCFRLPKRHHIHVSSSDAVPGNSSSKISDVTKRSDPSHNQSLNSVKMQNGISHVPREGAVERPTEQHCCGNNGKNAVSLKGIQIIENGTKSVSDKGKKAVSSGKSQIVENGNNVVSAAQLHSQHSVADSRLASKINNGTGSNSTVSAFDRGKGVESNAVNSPKKMRWVRNGYISPGNIAKAQKDLGKGKNGTIDEESSRVSSNHTQDGAHSKAQASDVSNKGKGIIPLSNDESGGQSTNDREAVTINEILGDDDLSGGWRRTHNRSKRTHPPPAERRLHPVDHTSTLSGDNNPLPRTQRLRPPFPARASSYDDSPPPLRQRLLDRTDMNRKSQQGSSSSAQDVRSQDTSDDSGVVFLGSSGDNNTVESRPVRPRRRSNNVARANEVDGASSSNSSVDPVMARQLEADEILARELQEQLYNEELGLRFGEIDVNERLDLQHEDFDFPPPPPRRTRQASTARTVSGNASRQPRARPRLNDARDFREFMAHEMRFRNHFPTRSRTLSSSSRNVSSLFPAEMDAGMMMTIWDSISDMRGVGSSLLQTNREFNENDYEMLLGLDENNHVHSGVSTMRINELPQTILENDLEEACAICLETPTTGDTIRHLPCFHKFHTDCIDPWLTRKSSCPVCKNSVT